MKLPFRRSASGFSLIFCAVLVLATVLYLLAVPRSVAALATFAVNTTNDTVDATPGDGICADSVGACSLRAAIMEANAAIGPDTINIPAGTYTLTRAPFDDEFNFDGAREDIGDLDILNGDVTIIGAGAASTIIDGGGIDRIFDINSGYTFSPGTPGNVRIENVTLRDGNSPTDSFGFNHSGGAIQFDGLDWNTFSLANITLTVVNCVISDNVAAGQGGGIASFNGGNVAVTGTSFSGNDSTNAQGGAIFFDGASDAGTRTFQVSTSSFAGNTAANATFGSGGAIWSGGSATVTIDNSSLTNNVAGANGGGIFADAFVAANMKTIEKNRIEDNSAQQGGGVFNRNGTLTFRLNVVVGNTASTDPTSTGFRQGTSSAPGSTSTLTNNWWGCNLGPSSAPCDRASGALGFGSGPWLVLSHTAIPNTIPVNTSTTLQADFYTNSSNAVVLPTDLVALNGRPILFNNAVLGTISAADTQISNGKANATYTAGNTGGTGSADATVDSQTVTAFINIQQAPGVTVNPTDQTACDGASVTFTAASTGFPPPTVQWQVSTDGGGSFSDIPGATSNALTFTATLAQNGNQYRAVFTNAAGSQTTTAATLTVITAPTITQNPSNVSTCDGGTATFTAAASDSTGVQWEVSTNGGALFTPIPGANSPTLTFTASSAQNGNQYRAVFSNSCGSTPTSAATLTIQPSTTTTDPADATVCQGATANFSTTAGGTGPFSYAWTVDGSPAGADSPNLAVDTTSMSVGNHTVVVTTTGACGSASQTANLTVNANTTTTDPADAAVCQGATANFSTTAGGTGPFSYAWTVDGSPAGTNSPNLAVDTTSMSVGNHTVVVTTTGACGTASQTANLTVNASATTTDPADAAVCQGATANFSTTAGGTGPFSYAWTVDGSPAGTNSPNLAVDTTSMSVGNHTVVVTTTGACGTASQTANLTVNANTTTSDPVDATVCQGATANFSTTAGGTGPFSYSWTVDGSPAGTNSPNLAVNTTSMSVGNHTVVVTTTGACGTASQSATLTVLAPTATTDPPDQSVCKGAIATFSTTASGTGPFNYAWTLDGLPYNGNSSSISVPTAALSSGPHTITVTTTGTCGSAMQTAILTVGGPPVITFSHPNLTLWPPNHHYHTFNAASFGATASGCGGNLTNSIVITSVSSDESENGNGDGNTFHDIVIAANCKSVQLRAERQGGGNGRVYRVNFLVTDSFGNSSTATAKVSVPKNANSTAVDNGPAAGYTVTSACP